MEAISTLHAELQEVNLQLDLLAGNQKAQLKRRCELEKEIDLREKDLVKANAEIKNLIVKLNEEETESSRLNKTLSSIELELEILQKSSKQSPSFIQKCMQNFTNDSEIKQSQLQNLVDIVESSGLWIKDSYDLATKIENEKDKLKEISRSFKLKYEREESLLQQQLQEAESELLMTISCTDTFNKKMEEMKSKSSPAGPCSQHIAASRNNKNTGTDYNLAFGSSNQHYSKYSPNIIENSYSNMDDNYAHDARYVANDPEGKGNTVTKTVTKIITTEEIIDLDTSGIDNRQWYQQLKRKRPKYNDHDSNK